MICEGFTDKKTLTSFFWGIDFYQDWVYTTGNSTRHASDTSGPGRVFFCINQSTKGENHEI